MTAHKPDLSWMTLFLAVVSHSSDVGSIPIARSGNPVDAVGFTGFLHPKFPLKTRVLDAVGRGFRPQRASWTRRFGNFSLLRLRRFSRLGPQSSPTILFVDSTSYAI